MTITEMKSWLDENGIEYSEHDYTSPDPQGFIQTWFPSLAKGKIKNRECKKLTLISNNGKKDLDILFKREGADFYFEDIVFGECDFEMGIYGETDKVTVVDKIQSVMRGDLKIITESDPDTGLLFNDSWYDLSVLDADESDYNSDIDRILNDKDNHFFKKVPHMYEIYDWNTYKCIVRK